MDFGILKEIDKVGRIVIPIELRKYYGIEQNDMLELIPTQEGILIKKHKDIEKDSINR